ncbi:MAG: 7-carboxy-7-deazaguanine synthase QueE [Muribaculaceae bacterium]|nr:7-carboxy-7-deazaguanine synthase QueE [Muribaculaceae bacterium]
MAFNTSASYRVNEIFYSLQGEGFYVGTPAVFLRFSGCNRACKFCDTNHSAYTEMMIPEILSALTAYPARHVVVTGGEPAMQLDEALVEALHSAGFYVQIETNGSKPVPDGVDWVTCSPKTPPYAIDRIDELKVVLTDDTDPDAVADSVPAAMHYFIQPCSGRNIKECVDYVLAHPVWRLSLQTHKLIDIQ